MWGAMGVFHIFIMVVVTRVYKLMKIHRTVHLKWHFGNYISKYSVQYPFHIEPRKKCLDTRSGDTSLEYWGCFYFLKTVTVIRITSLLVLWKQGVRCLTWTLGVNLTLAVILFFLFSFAFWPEFSLIKGFILMWSMYFSETKYFLIKVQDT